ncbi:hypothetical protein B0H19DRAFT_1077233 [Mycena capillaripes]|nr:hypothetical protein B0H19DRAFT_1077233 [Mycena capillaripes]
MASLGLWYISSQVLSPNVARSVIVESFLGAVTVTTGPVLQVLLAIIYASSLLALTVPTNSKHATHRIRSIANKMKLETFHMVSTYERVVRDVVSHAYAHQLIVSFEIPNHRDTVSNVAFDSNGLVVAVSSSFVKPSRHVEMVHLGAAVKSND